MKKLLLLLIIFNVLLAQGKIGGVTYFDYSYAEGKSAFNFNRQYFSYGIKISKDVNFRVVFDVGRTDIVCVTDGEGKTTCEDQRLVTFLKKAQVDYTCFIGIASFGMIGTNTYGVQEKNWGYRFIEKSAIDLKKFSSTADIGVAFSKTVAGNIHLNLQIVNGEGYKKPQENNNHKISINGTYGNSNLIKSDGFNIGAVFAVEGKPKTDGYSMASIFSGYAANGLRAGAEFDLVEKGNMKSRLISLSFKYRILEKFDVFSRIDYFDPDTKKTENMDSENNIITGVVLNCGNGLSVAPNVRLTNFENKTKTTLTDYRINLQFSF